MSSDVLTDEQLVARVQAGDTDLYEELVQRHRDMVFGLLAPRLPADAVAAVAHEVFVSAWVSLPGYREGAGFQRWLTRVALRRCHDHWRADYRDRARGRPLGAEDAEATPDAGAAAAPRRHEAADLLHAALARLDPDDRMVLTLVHLDERPVAEAAALLDWSPSRVTTRAHRARQRLREVLTRLDPDARMTT